MDRVEKLKTEIRIPAIDQLLDDRINFEDRLVVWKNQWSCLRGLVLLIQSLKCFFKYRFNFVEKIVLIH